MENFKKILPTLLLMLAVLAYTLYNYGAGKFGTGDLMIYLGIMLLPLLGMINSLRN